MARNKRGFALLESLAALGILAAVATSFLGALATADKAMIVADQQAMAESLARSQLESLKGVEYINYSVEGHPAYAATTVPVSYSATLTATPIDPSTLQPLPPGQDQGIQDILVTISRNGQQVFTVHDFKVNR